MGLLLLIIVIVLIFFMAKRHTGDSSTNSSKGSHTDSTDVPTDIGANSPEVTQNSVPVETSEPPVVLTRNVRQVPTIHKLRRKLFDFVVFDIETTGLDKDEDEIIQISAVKVKHDQVVDEFDTYVKPNWQIPNKITYLTGISNDDVSNAPTIKDALDAFGKFADNMPLVGHNIFRFDLPFLIENGFDQPDIQALDTWKLAERVFYPSDYEIDNLKLPTLKRYFGIKNASHNSLADCRTNVEVYQHLRGGNIEPAEFSPTSDKLAKLRFAISGEFIGIGRDDIKELIVDNGGRVTAAVSRLTDYLVDGEQLSEVLTDGVHSKKELDAMQFQHDGGKIKVIGLDDLYAMVGA